MKFSYNLLKTWLKFKQTPEELASLVDLHMTEVEAVTPISEYPGVIVGEILEIAPHPNADKLQLTKINTGKEVLRIVCGGKNIAVGQKVPVATIGTSLPNGMMITHAVIRGEESYGMLCSERELGLKETVDGVMVLNKASVVGATLDEALELSPDYQLEIKVLSNRPDYMSYFSTAREIAAILKIPFEPPIDLTYPEVKFKTKDYLKVGIKDKEACSRYIARLVRNVQVKPPPVWLKKVLRAAGIRSINNLVDIANYVMLETGHPVHVFDYNKIASTEIVVRYAKPKEKLLCLDGVQRELDSSMAVIADLKQPIAVAGIIGGEESGVTEETVDIVIEVANFDRTNIRKTARKLGLRTDASARFERGVDILDSENVMARLLHLIHTDCPEASVFADDIDVHGALPAVSRDLKIAIADVNKIIGLEIAGQEMANILTRLNLPTKEVNGELAIEVPHYRQDVNLPADIAEEVLRLYGSDKITSILPTSGNQVSELPPIFILSRFIKRHLAALGLTEVQTHAFTTETKGAVALENPLTTNWTHLKTDLLTPLFGLEINKGDISIFEINNIFLATKSDLPDEAKQLAVRVTSRDGYRKARGVLEWLSGRLNLEISFVELPDGSGLKINQGKISVGRLVIYDKSTAGFTLNLTAILEAIDYTSRYREAHRFPAVKMDMAFAIPKNVKVGEMIVAISKLDKRVDRVELFDDFDLGDSRSVAFHIELRSDEGTLSHEIRDEVHSQIKAALAKQFKASLRE